MREFARLAANTAKADREANKTIARYIGFDN